MLSPWALCQTRGLLYTPGSYEVCHMALDDVQELLHHDDHDDKADDTSYLGVSHQRAVFSQSFVYRLTLGQANISTGSWTDTDSPGDKSY